MSGGEDAERLADLQEPVGDDAVRPFAVDALDVRGRAVQMGPALNAILARHDYPPPVARLLAEATVLTALLGSSLKFDGRFTLQTETNGPIDMIVVDYRTTGAVRGYARFDADSVADAGQDAASLLGKGHLAMTIDQGGNTNRYQGIVALDGETLEEAAHTYFLQSEQIPTRIRIAVAEMQRRDGERLETSWRAGGLMVQHLPNSGERPSMPDLPGGDAPEGVDVPDFDEDDGWREARLLADTVEDIELTDPDLPIERLLFRLFNERGVMVFESSRVHDECSCSRPKVEGVLSGFSEEEIRESTEDGVITVRCQFCSRAYEFDPLAFAS